MDIEKIKRVFKDSSVVSPSEGYVDEVYVVNFQDGEKTLTAIALASRMDDKRVVVRRMLMTTPSVAMRIADMFSEEPRDLTILRLLQEDVQGLVAWSAPGTDEEMLTRHDCFETKCKLYQEAAGAYDTVGRLFDIDEVTRDAIYNDVLSVHYGNKVYIFYYFDNHKLFKARHGIDGEMTIINAKHYDLLKMMSQKMKAL